MGKNRKYDFKICVNKVPEKTVKGRILGKQKFLYDTKINTVIFHYIWLKINYFMGEFKFKFILLVT